MKVIIAGSREGATEALVRAALRSAGLMPKDVTEVVSGTCRGVDQIGETIAKAHGIPIKPFPANWYPNGPKGKLDKTAGHKRNAQMVRYADMLVAAWDGHSTGTENMIQEMAKLGKPFHVYRY